MSLVLWSGGCDSTLVLWDLLQKQSRNDPPIRTLSIDHFAVWAGKEQAAAREKIMGVLRKQGYRVENELVTIQCGDRTGLPSKGPSGSGTSGFRIPQAALWIGQAVEHLEPEENLYVGYIRGDDMWHHVQEWRWAFQYMAYLVGRTGNLFAPLEWSTKANVIERLRGAGLFPYCWTCSDPKDGKECGRCKECMTQYLAVYELSLKDGKSVKRSSRRC